MKKLHCLHNYFSLLNQRFVYAEVPGGNSDEIGENYNPKLKKMEISDNEKKTKSQLAAEQPVEKEGLDLKEKPKKMTGLGLDLRSPEEQKAAMEKAQKAIAEAGEKLKKLPVAMKKKGPTTKGGFATAQE